MLGNHALLSLPVDEAIDFFGSPGTTEPPSMSALPDVRQIECHAR